MKPLKTHDSIIVNLYKNTAKQSDCSGVEATRDCAQSSGRTLSLVRCHHTKLNESKHLTDHLPAPFSFLGKLRLLYYHDYYVLHVEWLLNNKTPYRCKYWANLHTKIDGLLTGGQKTSKILHTVVQIADLNLSLLLWCLVPKTMLK